MSFQISSLEQSTQYSEMKSSYDIGGGIGGFWSWLGISGNASTHKDEIHTMFQQVQQSQQVNGTADYDLQVTGLYPNVEVDASAYVLVMQVSNTNGNSFVMASSGDPTSDTGSQDQNGNSLPTKNNNSTIRVRA